MLSISKFLLALSATLVTPILLAHEGHGGGSLVQHALEHGYMLLVPVVVIALIAMTARGKGSKNKID